MLPERTRDQWLRDRFVFAVEYNILHIHFGAVYVCHRHGDRVPAAPRDVTYRELAVRFHVRQGAVVPLDLRAGEKKPLANIRLPHVLCPPRRVVNGFPHIAVILGGETEPVLIDEIALIVFVHC